MATSGFSGWQGVVWTFNCWQASEQLCHPRRLPTFGVRWVLVCGNPRAHEFWWRTFLPAGDPASQSCQASGNRSLTEVSSAAASFPSDRKVGDFLPASTSET